MAASRYSVRWLDPDHAAAVAALEAQVHTPSHRAGKQIIQAQLQATADEGRNLSLGLFHKNRLVGFLLAFHTRNRREISEFFDAPVPAGLDPDERTLYIADFVVAPGFRHASSLLVRRLREIVKGREELRNLNVDAFSTEEYARLWSARSGFLQRFSLKLTGKHPFTDQRLKTTLYWLTFAKTSRWEPAASTDAALKASRRFRLERSEIKVGVIDNALDWETLRPYWDILLERTGRFLPQQSHAWLHKWWSHMAAAELDPFIVVALRNGIPCAIAPLQIVYRSWLGRPLRCLQFMGEGPDTIAGTLMAAPDDTDAHEAIARYLVSRKRLWHTLLLGLPDPAHPFAKALQRNLHSKGFHHSFQQETAFGQTTLPTLTGNRLHGHDAALRFSTLSSADDLAAGLLRYADIEAGSHGIRLGISVSTATFSFYKSIVEAGFRRFQPAFSFLSHENQDVAGLFSFVYNDTLCVEHVIQRGGSRPGNLCSLLILKRLEQLREQGVQIARLPAAIAQIRQIAADESEFRLMIHARRPDLIYDFAEAARFLINAVTKRLGQYRAPSMLYPRFRIG